MRKLGRTTAILLACCVLLSAIPAGAEMIFDGAVTGGTVVPVLASYGGLVDQMVVQAGDRVSVGDVVAKMQTTKVYAACEGTISGVFGAEGRFLGGDHGAVRRGFIHRAGEQVYDRLHD